MNLTQFKRRLLDSFLVTINITKMEVNVEYEERVESFQLTVSRE